MSEIENTNNLYNIINLRKYFTSERPSLTNILRKDEGQYIRAVDGVTFSIKKGETFSLVGETGSGKTTIGRMVIRLIEPTSGSIFFDNNNLLEFNETELKKFRSQASIIFQDPFASLNPRMTIGQSIQLPLDINGKFEKKEKEEIVLDTMERVGLFPAYELINRYPHEFSGGQRQRIGIARAIISNPQFIVADEPVTSLDVSIRAQILNLLEDLKNNYKLTYLLIAHDLSLVRHMSDRVLVLYLGKPMELAKVDKLFDNPLHPYTQALISAVPVAASVKKAPATVPPVLFIEKATGAVLEATDGSARVNELNVIGGLLPE